MYQPYVLSLPTCFMLVFLPHVYRALRALLLSVPHVLCALVLTCLTCLVPRLLGDLILLLLAASLSFYNSESFVVGV